MSDFSKNFYTIIDAGGFLPWQLVHPKGFVIGCYREEARARAAMVTMNKRMWVC